MKSKDPHEPYMQSHFPHYLGMGLCCAGLAIILPLFINSLLTGSLNGMVFCGVELLIATAGLLLLWHSLYPRFIISMDGVELFNNRKGWRIMLPWSNYSYMYTLTGYKAIYCLFSDRPMDKTAQYAAFKACRRNRERPGTAEGCLLLTGVLPEVTARLPEHITQFPEWKCCSFWDGYRSL